MDTLREAHITHTHTFTRAHEHARTHTHTAEIQDQYFFSTWKPMDQHA